MDPRSKRPSVLAVGKRPFDTIIPGFMEKGDRHIFFGIMGGSRCLGDNDIVDTECIVCRGAPWVSEDHPDKPWDGASEAPEACGHFILCVGPTRDGSQFIILDPMKGVRYIDRQDVTDASILYDNSGGNGGSIGIVDVTKQKAPKPTKVDTDLVEYVARGRFSKSGVIVTYPSL